MVDATHPPAFLALAFAQCAGLPPCLELLAVTKELAASEPLLSPVPEEAVPRARSPASPASPANDMHDRRDFDAQINPHDPLVGG